MPDIRDVLVPDIGDFEAVEVIEVPVNDDDEIQQEDTLITLESDKATIDIPSPYSGTIKSVSTKVGDKVSQGDLILTMEVEGKQEGVTKILFDKESNRIIGAGIVCPNAGDLIAECALAIEMGADAEDIGLTIHPHPTLSETIGLAAEVFAGTITDLYIPKRKK